MRLTSLVRDFIRVPNTTLFHFAGPAHRLSPPIRVREDHVHAALQGRAHHWPAHPAGEDVFAGGLLYGGGAAADRGVGTIKKVA